MYSPTGSGAPVQPRPDLGAAVSFGWDRFSQNLAPHLIAALVLFGSMVVGYGLMFLTFAILSTTYDTGYGFAVTEGPGFFGTMVGFFIVIAAFLLGSFPLRNSALQEASGQSPTTSSIFKSSNLKPFLLVSLVLLVVEGVLAMIPFIGLFLAAVLPTFWWFAPFVALQYGSDPVKALQRSFEITIKNMNWLYLFVCGLIAAVGTIGCGIGIFATAPLAMLAAAFLYKGSDPQTAP